MDYPGWDNERHCRCGLIQTDGEWRTRTMDAALLDQLRLEQTLLAWGQAR
jgi:hypothetical protein